MRDRLIELHEEAGVAWDRYIDECQDCGNVSEKTYHEFHADYLLENGVIVPPCKVGDKVWIKDRRFDCLKRKFESFINEGYVKAIKISLKPMKITIEYPVVNDSRGRCKGADYAATSIGKSVFLTKEEAEEALKERERG